MDTVASVTKRELSEDPSAKLWALIMYLAENVEAQSSEQFRTFWLTYIYDAQVMNGGHLQYFVNKGLDETEETIAALIAIGAKEQALILEECLKEALQMNIPKINTLQEYSSLAEASSFSQDSKYYSVKPEVLEV
ncbi:DMP19 family protein [Microbulbifer sp. JMSA003]|uniref:DMP19 family protein n=1 Tax=Microbulbifer sp. JMSA003 TaxID=3243369 RepID=UPI004039E2F4